MSLLNSITFTPQGLTSSITIDKSVLIIERVDTYKTHSDIYYHVYESETAMNAGFSPLFDVPVEKFAPVLDGGDDIYKQAYNHLKTLDMFTGAIDC